MPPGGKQIVVPPERITRANARPIRPDGEFVLYWCIAYRRTGWNFALDRAIEHASTLGKPLVLLEALKLDYPWASDRFHRFVIQGMACTARSLREAAVLYYPFVERRRHRDNGLLAALARRAAVVVTDEFPCFFLPGMVGKAAAAIDVLVEQVDSNGLMPLRASAEAFGTAHAFRRHLQATIRPALEQFPMANPLRGIALPRLAKLPSAITRKWPPALDALLFATAWALADLPIDHTVAAVDLAGGTGPARAALKTFLTKRLDRYDADRNRPECEGASGLSPYLHFGHLSAHEVFSKLAAREDWSPLRLGTKVTGARAGWWGMSASAEAFLDQVVTWRELGYNGCFHRPDYDQWDSLPAWVRGTLSKHASDVRPHRYTLPEFAAARTHDPLWNAAQNQLVRDGTIHNYLRMLWGKKILEWSASPEESLEIMIELNNKYALDGRDPNSYSGIFWCLGRYDRPWGPERPIFGTVRYMSSENTARKYQVGGYLERFG